MRGLFVFALIAALGTAAHGQGGTPRVITLPGANNFDLRPGTPTPTPTPSARPTPRVTATPRAAPSPRTSASPTPRPTATSRQPIPRPSVTPRPSPVTSGAPVIVTPTPTSTTTDLMEPVPTPVITASPLALPSPAAAQPSPRPNGDAILSSLGLPAMSEQLSLALFAGGALLLGLIVVLLFGRRGAVKRRRMEWESPPEEQAAPPAPPFAAPVPSPPAVSPAPPQAEALPEPALVPPVPVVRATAPPPPPPLPPAPQMMASRRTPEPRSVATADQPGLKLEFQPMRAGIDGNMPVVELNLTVRNIGREAAANIRIRPGMISASPDQERQMEAFHAATVMGGSAFQPFTLAPGEEQRVPIRLNMPQEAIHVVTVSDRPIFMPIVMIDLAWRGGLSLKRMGADFMVGIETTQGAPGTGRLGPFWLDRGARMFEDVSARIIRRAK